MTLSSIGILLIDSYFQWIFGIESGLVNDLLCGELCGFLCWKLCGFLRRELCRHLGRELGGLFCGKLGGLLRRILGVGSATDEDGAQFFLCQPASGNFGVPA